MFKKLTQQSDLPPTPGGQGDGRGEARGGARTPREADAVRVGFKHIFRALKLLKNHKAKASGFILLSLLTMLLPFVVGIAFGPLLQVLASAAVSGQWDDVWSLQGSLYSKAPGSKLSGFEEWMATPVTFTSIFVLWVGARVLNNVLRVWKTNIDARLDQGLLADIKQSVHDHVQNLSLDFFSAGKTGALMQRVLSDPASLQRFLTDIVLTQSLQVVVTACALLYLIGLSWRMTLVAFALAPLGLLTLRLTSGHLRRASRKMVNSSRNLSAEIEETISGISDVQIFNAQEKRSEAFRRALEVVARDAVRVAALSNLNNTAAQLVIVFSSAAVMFAGIVYGQHFGLSFAGIIIFLQFVPNVFQPLQQLVNSYTQFQSLAPSIASTYELLDTQPTVKERHGAREMRGVHGHITFEHVSFGYKETQKVIDDVSFHIREGETVAIVGPIGCGKSTITKLLLRFLQPHSGRIVVDGYDIADVTHKSLRTEASKLSQFPFFFKESIRENIRLAKPDAADDEIEEACKLAHVHDIITNPKHLPDGYDTVIDSQVPSGGQKRLIALARCLIRKPEILLLDEPTENLDVDQRNRLVKVLREYALERTCVVISHDLNFVAGVADRILMLNHGRILDQGTHDELVAREGLYKTLYQLENMDPTLLRNQAAPAPPLQPAPITG